MNEQSTRSGAEARAPLPVFWAREAPDFDTYAATTALRSGPLDRCVVIGAPEGRFAEYRRYDDAADVLARIADDFPDRPLFLQRVGLQPPARLDEIVKTALSLLEAHTAVAFPGNHDQRFDPLAGLDADAEHIDRLLYWCSDRAAVPVAAPVGDCLLIAAGAARGCPAAPALDAALLLDDGYFVDRGRSKETRALNEEAAVDLPHGRVRMRVQRLLEAGDATSLPEADGRPVTLHVAHSWGGGVWQWIDDVSAGDPSSVHLVLVAVSDPDGRTCGRRLELRAGGPGGGLIREMALMPVIPTVAPHHAGYREHLDAVIRRFGAARVIVSSLIGHALDCLRTGRPTIAMLHDFFPLWPLLDRDPMPFIDAAHGDPSKARRDALSAHSDSLQFEQSDADAWDAIATAWREAVAADGIVLAAPTGHVAERCRALTGDEHLEIHRIPHGFRDFESDPPAFEAPDDGPLHLVIPGRLIAGKGLDLLRRALPKLRGRVRLTALGCGRDGLALMGEGGIDLVPQYRREALPELVAALRPHAALLLSTVPETWSYTLSEMRALGLVPIATRIGSFAERIDDGRNGVLFEPTVEGLVGTIERLAANREELSGIEPSRDDLRAIEAVADDLGSLLNAGEDHAVSLPDFVSESAARATEAMQASRLAQARRAAAAADAERRRMADELASRSRWAETMERQFRARSAWAERLEVERRAQDERLREQADALERQDRQYHELSDLHRETLARHDELEGRFDELASRYDELTSRYEQLVEEHAKICRLHDEALARHDALRREHDRLVQDHEHLVRRRDDLQTEYDRLVASRSWRITRPLRFATRAARNLRARNAINPLRWPRLVARFVHHWRLRGLRNALMMLQGEPATAEQPAPIAAEPEPSAAEPAEPVSLPECDRPSVTIVVPVYNQLEYTAVCLESLAAVRTEVPFEVVVVDDASSDATPEWLERCDGICFARNEENLGFIGSCNRGATMARGECLVFLNNDTRVTDDWLDRLVEPLRSRDDVGVVGARLVYADGTLQEAGGIVFRDASGWNYGRGDHPDRPEYRFVGEVDYVSGACLAIRRDLFESLGGFDRHFAPAYYEDTDLCFRVRQRGLAVLYQPAATVVHFEGVTSGTDESSGAKRYQAVNRERFLERWQDVLSGHPENPGEFTRPAARAFRDRRLPRRALVIDAVTPAPDQDSGSMRMFAMLKLLVDMGFRTSFMPENLAWAGRHSSALEQAGIEVLTAPWLNDPEDWLSEHGDGLDLVIVSRHYVLSPLVRLIRALCPNARLVFDTVDLHFLREQREAELAGTQAAARAAERTRAEELALVAEADATLVVSEFERELLTELAPGRPVSVVSNIHSLQDPGKPFEQRHGLVFVGGFQHPPNLDAAEWLIDEILPRVIDRLPEVQLHLIGSKMPDSVKHRRAPGLCVHGFVADLEPFLAGCRISVAPLRFGAGVKGKVNQAMSHGLPVVATSCAAEGMYTVDGHDVLLADDAQTFAERVVALYRDRTLWQRLAVNGRKNVERHFSVDAARRALAGVLTDLGMRLDRDVGSDADSG